jgi:hypothetical protein
MMSHDKIKAAARERMAQTGEPYAVARRAVIRERQAVASQRLPPGTAWFTIRFSDAGLDRVTRWLDTLLGGGPGRSGVEVDAGQIRVRMADFSQTIPRSSIRHVHRSQAQLRGTTGVHVSRGRLLVNGSAHGLVELAIEPPCYTSRTLNTMFVRQKVTALILSLDDPDGFIAAVNGDGIAKEQP